jgi:hypothetical protein
MNLKRMEQEMDYAENQPPQEMSLDRIRRRLDLIEDAAVILRACCEGDNGKYTALLIERCVNTIRNELDRNPTDPHDAERRALAEKAAAGETR